MIVIKYVKRGYASFISHIDLLKHMGRIIRRADIPVEFSQGFNPHPIVFFSPPMCLGARSECEYVFLSTPLLADEAFERYKKAVNDDLMAIDYFEVKKNPNLQANVAVADYVYPVPFKEIDFSSFVVKYQKKGEDIEEDVSNKIFGAYEYDGKLCIKLASGNSPLRPDRLISRLNNLFNVNISLTEVVKIKQYVLVDGKYIDVDTYLKN